MTGAELAPFELAGRLALASGLAVFLGLAFEEVYKRQERSSPGGVRTFPMLALSGAMLYLIEPQHALAFIVGLFALAVWLHAYLRNALFGPNATSMMIPASNLLAYLIGPVALTQPPWMVVAVSVTAVILLGTREQFHRLIQLVPQDELLTAGKFLILVGIVLPLVPNQPVTAATPLTPYHVWLAVVAVCTLSYLSYLLQKYVSASAAFLPAILGGVYSSTVTTVTLAKRQREVGLTRSDLSAGILAATAVMYVRLGVVIALFDVHLAWALSPTLLTLFALGAAMTAYEWRRMAERQRDANLSVPVINPLQIPFAIIFAAIFVIISVVTAWIRVTFGQTGVLAMAIAVGATDIDPFVINIAQGGVTGLSVTTLSAAILIAASSNNIAKAIYALGFGGVKSSRRPALMLFVLAILGVTSISIPCARAEVEVSSPGAGSPRQAVVRADACRSTRAASGTPSREEREDQERAEARTVRRQPGDEGHQHADAPEQPHGSGGGEDGGIPDRPDRRAHRCSHDLRVGPSRGKLVQRGPQLHTVPGVQGRSSRPARSSRERRP